MGKRSKAPLPYPVFLKLEGQRCVVFGAGPIAAQKARELLASGASVEVISPELGMEWYSFEGYTHFARPYEAGDLVGARIAISATADPEVDDLIYREGQREGVLVNIVDVPPRCDFYAGGVVRRGRITVCIGTDGTSPSLAIAIREAIDKILPSNLGELAEHLGAKRPELKSQMPVYKERAARMNRVIRGLFDHLREGGELETAKAAVEIALHCKNDCGKAEKCCALDGVGL